MTRRINCSSLLFALIAVPVRLVVAQADAHVHNEKGGGAAPQLGTVVFPTAANRRAQTSFLRGMAFLHSFHYEEAAKDFQAAERADSAFAMPYWFEAFTHSHPLWGEDDPAAARQTLARLAPTPAARLAHLTNRRERGFAAAIEAFFADTTLEVRARAFADSMHSLTTAFPTDLEAAAFASLALMVAIDQDAYPNDQIGARSNEMLERAEFVFRMSPNHPGAAHYLIHVSDIDPSFTQRSLPAARVYARIAPDASHALHMPSHVFIRLGLWDEVASSNERSWAASRREMARDQLSGADLDAHSLQFLAYAYLESGRWKAARALLDTARRVIGDADVSGALHVDGRYAVSELSFLVAAETGAWKDVVLPPSPRPPVNQRDQGFQITSAYARAVTLGMQSDTASLASAATIMRARADSMPRGRPPDYIASELEALVARARGDTALARERLRHAADFEDRLPVVGPPRFLIARELLGQLYLQSRRPDSAAAEFEQALRVVPNRSRALLGLARARVALGDRTGARKVYAQLAANWRRADANVPALAEVRDGAAGRLTFAQP